MATWIFIAAAIGSLLSLGCALLITKWSRQRRARAQFADREAEVIDRVARSAREDEPPPLSGSDAERLSMLEALLRGMRSKKRGR